VEAIGMKMTPTQQAKMQLAKQRLKSFQPHRENRDDWGSKRRQATRELPEFILRKLESAFSGRSRKAAVEAKCYECYGYEDVRDIRTCKAEECPLWEFRPYRVR
jgi:hypothetical protein